ncbi:MAG TPA: LeuA family protein [Gemmatimonadales bacterium]|nr:LeuA family protein [Gemmatimonadales bacterium]
MPRSLIHDWNGERAALTERRIELNDETLRDGLQSPSVTDPPPETKLRLLHLMADLGIAAVTVGFPAAGPRMLAQARLLAQEIARARLPLAANASARTVEADIAPIATLAQETGVPLEAAVFIGASAIRRESQAWTLTDMLRLSEDAVRFAVREGLSVMFVLEDASRTDPETLRALYGHAIGCGARRLCLADTTGHATPAGVERLARFVRDEVIAPSGERVRLDWHGHRDRGLAVANCLAAIAAGADRVHGTALGAGERAGNAEMELLLANFHLMGIPHGDLTRLAEYCRLVSQALGLTIPTNQPVVGSDAFRTASGIHAAAILRAEERGDTELAELTYSSLPASVFGLAQQFALSPMSGHASVRHWLREHGHDPTDEPLVEALLAAAKQADRALSDGEAERVVRAAAVSR